MINIFDCNNWVRVKYETDSTGMALRNLYTEAFSSPDTSFYIFDGYNSKASRRKIYPEYKGNRPKVADTFYETLNTFKQLILHTNKISIEVPEFEADDVIAYLTKGYKGPIPIKIFSTDKDFAVLVNEYVTTSSSGILNVNPIDVRLYKALVRDKSDNVKGIDKFGDAAWGDLTQETKDRWVQFLNKESEMFPLQGLSKGCERWVSQNIDLLRAYWQVVDFLPMTEELIGKYTKVGQADYAAADAILKKVYL